MDDIKTNKSFLNISDQIAIGASMVLVALVLLSFYFSKTMMSQKHLLLENNLQQIASDIGSSVNQWTEKNVNTILLLSQFQSIKSMDKFIQLPVLEEIKNSSETIHSFSTYSFQGKEILHTDPTISTGDLTLSQLQQLQNGRSVSQNLANNNNISDSLVCFTVPVNDKNLFLGALKQCSYVNQLIPLIERYDIKNTYTLFLTNKSNEIALSLGSDSSNSAVVDQVLLNTDKDFSGLYERDARLMYFEELNLGWSLAISKSSSVSIIKGFNNYFLLIFSIIASGLIIFAFVWIKKLFFSELVLVEKNTEQLTASVADKFLVIDEDGAIDLSLTRSLYQNFSFEVLDNSHNFYDYLNKHVDADVVYKVKEYFSSLRESGATHPDARLYNPLKGLQIKSDFSNAHVVGKTLGFDVAFLKKHSNQVKLVLIVKDLTIVNQLRFEVKVLERNIVSSNALFLDCLVIPRHDLLQFLVDSRDVLDKVKITLSSLKVQDSHFSQTMDNIFRLVHKTRRDALNIRFKSFAEECYALEELINHTRFQSGVQKQELVDIVTSCLDIIDRNHYITDLLNDSAPSTEPLSMSEQEKEAGVPEHLLDWVPLRETALQLAKNNNKLVEVHLRGFKTKLPENYQNTIMTVANQLVKYSVLHGIESAPERENNSKLREGQITMSLKYAYGIGYIFTYMDDGQGIDFQHLKQQLLGKAAASENHLPPFSEKDLVKAIFKPDFGKYSGIGDFSLSDVANQVENLDGTINVSSVAGKRIIFKVVLPCKSLMVA